MRTMKIGALRIDRGRSRADLGRKLFAFTPQQWQVLDVLLDHMNKLVSRPMLLYLLGTCGVRLSESALRYRIHALRRKLAGLGLHIRAVHGLGYVLERAARATSARRRNGADERTR